jgi:hypothetical protein
MILARFRTIALALLVSIAAVGCENPTSVGLDVIGEIGGDPVIRSLDPNLESRTAFEEVTGQNQRILVGHVNDPILGAIRADAYLDFGAMVGTATFRDNEVVWAALELQRDYAVGDTVLPIEVSLYDMPAEWNAQGATSDTSLVRGGYIGTFSVSPFDSVITLPLPQDWIARNDTTLRSTSFPEVFHGFMLEAPDANAVFGFRAGNATLRAATAVDSVFFPQSRNLTTTERLTQPNESADYTVLQGTAGPIITLNYDLQGIRNEFGLNRATIRVREDSVAAMSQLAPHFHRSRAERLNLHFRTHDGNLLLVETASRQENGDFLFRTSELHFLMDQLLRGIRQPGTFELRLPSNPNTLDHLLIRRGEDVDPTMQLVLTPFLD